MKLKELRALNSDELAQKQGAIKKELFELNFQRKSAQVEKTGRFKTLRRSIARILTILKEREKDGKR